MILYFLNCANLCAFVSESCISWAYRPEDRLSPREPSNVRTLYIIAAELDLFVEILSKAHKPDPGGTWPAPVHVYSPQGKWQVLAYVGDSLSIVKHANIQCFILLFGYLPGITSIKTKCTVYEFTKLVIVWSILLYEVYKSKYI